MGADSALTARVDRLRGLYAEQFREQFDGAEFLSDDFYAFQVLERSFQVGERNRELYNLALLMHAERKALMETGQRQVLDAVRNTARQALSDAMAPSAAAVTKVLETSVPNHTGRLRALAGQLERRSGKVRLSAQEITILSALRRTYHKYYGQGFDVEEFVLNDLYAKVVLAEAMASGQAELAGLAREFVGQSGKLRQHRRQGNVHVDLNACA
jgi:hypothetical protein